MTREVGQKGNDLSPMDLSGEIKETGDSISVRIAPFFAFLFVSNRESGRDTYFGVILQALRCEEVVAPAVLTRFFSSPNYLPKNAKIEEENEPRCYLDM